VRKEPLAEVIVGISGKGEVYERRKEGLPISDDLKRQGNSDRQIYVTRSKRHLSFVQLERYNLKLPTGDGICGDL
jgi:hypothetical protein